jgi:hypothetical protein
VTEFLFADNTVLCNFAAVERLDLLRSILAGRGRWTEAVAYEAHRSAAYLPALRALPLEGWLDLPIAISDEADVRQVERLRRAVFGGTHDRPLRHLGEAQTCYLIRHWAWLRGSWWLSDDQESVRYARRQSITTRETIDLMRMGVDADSVSAGDAFDLMVKMSDNDRRLRLPGTPEDLSRERADGP